MTAPAVVKQPSLWEDLLEIFYAPRAVFERRRETPAFGLALVVLVVASVVLTLAFAGVTEPIMDAETSRGMRTAMKQNPQLTAEQFQQGAKFFSKFLVVMVGGFFLLAPLLLGLCGWLVAKIVDSKAQLGQMMMVTTYAMFPRLLESIVNAVQCLILPDTAITGRFSVTLGVGRFLNPDTQMMAIAILGRVDVFTLWVTFIIAVGISVMGRIPMARAAIAAAIIWLIGGLPAILGALRA
jgi:hypothetical protein